MSGPLHRPVDVRTLPQAGYRETIRPNESERDAFAEANGIVAVESFEADVVVGPWRAEGVRVSGRVIADIVQSCVVTLEPVASRVDETFDATFVPEGSPLVRDGHEGEILIDADGEDAPETFTPPTLDVGAIVAEFFTLGLDPYPRAPGAELPATASDGAKSPFAALSALKGE